MNNDLQRFRIDSGFAFDVLQKFAAVRREKKSFPNPPDTQSWP